MIAERVEMLNEERPMTLEERLSRIETMLVVLVERERREWYSVEQFSRLVERSEFTVREWSRLGRIQAQKKLNGSSWVISHEELQRYQREGLLRTA
jgi:hypothetical protein